MKRLAWSLLLVAGVLAACAPQATIVNDVVPTLISVQLPEDEGDPIRLDGRYFGDGQGGEAEDSHVVIGAGFDCTGGVEVPADSWTSRRITFRDPGGVGSGFVCVVVNGISSNALPLDLN